MGVFKLLTAEQFKAVLASPHLNTRYEEQVFAFAFAFAFAFVIAFAFAFAFAFTFVFAFEIEFVIDRLSSPKHKIRGAGFRRLYSYVLWWESSLCKTPHFQWNYGKLNQIYGKLRSDQMDPKSELGGPKPISRTGGSLLKNWSYTSNQCIYISILLYWRPHLAKTLFFLHKYIKCALL